jgi:ketosteroid isomerase-like protein
MLTVEEATRLTQTFVGALNRRDRDGWIAAFHPDLEGYSGLVAAMEGDESYVGLEGAGVWFDDLLEVYETLHASLEQTIVVGNHALQLMRVEYVAKASGAILSPVLTWVCEIRDGRFVYAHSHFDFAEGFADMARVLARH